MKHLWPLLFLIVCVQSINYVVILVDDLGYGDINLGFSPFNRSNVNTPYLKQMAQEGVTFDNFYAGASICTPSRAALLTGRFPPLVQMFGYNRVFVSPGQSTGLRDQDVTLASALKNTCGYVTGMTGKWHLGVNKDTNDDGHWLPTNKGFDVAELISPFGMNTGCAAGSMAPCQYNGTESYFPICPILTDTTCPTRPYIPLNCTFGVQIPIGGTWANATRNTGLCTLYRGTTIVQQPWDPANLTPRTTAEALKFLDNRAEDNKPFFYYFSHYAVHDPIQTSTAFYGKSAAGTYGDVVEEMDWSVGEILKRLNRGDIGPTLVFWYSDNGPFLEPFIVAGTAVASRPSAGPLRGSKGQHYEGGNRVPALVWGNNRLSEQITIQRGVVTHAVGAAVDIYKTISSQLAAAGVCQINATLLSGADLTPVLQGTTSTSTWQAPGNYYPYFCENIIIAVRFRDPGNATLGIAAANLKLNLAVINYTLPSQEVCPVFNPYIPNACMCSQLIPLIVPNVSQPQNAANWLQLYNLDTNLNEVANQTLLSLSNPRLAYYLGVMQRALIWIQKFNATFDGNPYSANGRYDVRSSTPMPDIGRLLPCCGGVDPCNCNKEAGATRIILTSSPQPAFFGQNVTFTATVSEYANSSNRPANGNITFYYATPITRYLIGATSVLRPSITVSGLIAKGVIPTIISVVAQFEGLHPSFAAGTSNEYLQKILPAQTSLKLSSSANPSVFGQEIILTATLTIPTGSYPVPPQGSIAFYNGNSLLQVIKISTLTTILPVTNLPVGSGYSILAKFVTADNNFGNSTSNSLIQVVNQAPTSVDLQSSSSSVVTGEYFTLTATISVISPGSGNPSGFVTFSDDSTLLGTVTLVNKVATLDVALNAETHNLIATYDGDSSFALSKNNIQQLVNKAQTRVELTSSKSDTVSGEHFTLTVFVSVSAPGAGIPSGTVSFYQNSVLIGSVPVSNNLASLDVAFNTGSYSLSASYSGDANFLNSESVEITHTVTPAATEITSTLPSFIRSATPISFKIIVSPKAPGAGIPTGVLSVSCNGFDFPIATLDASGSVVFSFPAFPFPSGQYSVIIGYKGDSNFSPSVNTLFTIVYSFPDQGGYFLVGDLSAGIGKNVTFGGKYWSQSNILSSGTAPSDFWGYAREANQICGGNWSAKKQDDGNKWDLPAYLGTGVTSQVTLNKETRRYTGTASIVVVQTTKGSYSGTIVGSVCA